jgi:acetolactate synthase I/II/III large subunit
MNGAGERIGAQILVDTLVEYGCGPFFMNPGTSEMHLVAAIDENPKAKGVLCLFEGVATGAADGYGRVTGKPAVCLLHLGPGLANGLANLHNAQKAATPILVIVGEHATNHLRYETPLKSDLDRLPPFISKSVARLHPSADIADLAATAFRQASVRPRGISTVIATADTMWLKSGVASQKRTNDPDSTAGSGQQLIDDAVTALRSARAAAILLGGESLSTDGLRLAGSIAEATGAALLCETFNAKHARGAGRPSVARIPYFPEFAIPFLAKHDVLILVGAASPASFFASPDQPGDLVSSSTRTIALSRHHPLSDLRAIQDAIGVAHQPRLAERRLVPLASGALVPEAIWATLNHHLPDHAIVVDEAGVSSRGADDAMALAAPHDWLNLTGGSIGQGIPVATGAAIGQPDRKVVVMQGDGGALYTIQALWTQAREKLNVINVILNNGQYAILGFEAKRHGLKLGEGGRSMLDLGDPSMDWIAIARGFGVEAFAASTAEEFNAAFKQAVAARGPVLIDARLSRRSAR